MTQCAALTMAAIPTTSPAPGHAGGGVKVSSEPERGERGEREACSDPDKRREKEKWCPAETRERTEIKSGINIMHIPLMLDQGLTLLTVSLNKNSFTYVKKLIIRHKITFILKNLRILFNKGYFQYF